MPEEINTQPNIAQPTSGKTSFFSKQKLLLALVFVMVIIFVAFILVTKLIKSRKTSENLISKLPQTTVKILAQKSAKQTTFKKTLFSGSTFKDKTFTVISEVKKTEVINKDALDTKLIFLIPADSNNLLLEKAIFNNSKTGFKISFNLPKTQEQYFKTFSLPFNQGWKVKVPYVINKDFGLILFESVFYIVEIDTMAISENQTHIAILIEKP